MPVLRPELGFQIVLVLNRDLPSQDTFKSRYEPAVNGRIGARWELAQHIRVLHLQSYFLLALPIAHLVL